MTQDDLKLRALAKTFNTLGQDVGGDARREDINRQRINCAREVIALKASTRHGMRIKARILVALSDAGATDVAIDVARSLAADLDNYPSNK